MLRADWPSQPLEVPQKEQIIIHVHGQASDCTKYESDATNTVAFQVVMLVTKGGQNR